MIEFFGIQLGTFFQLLTAVFTGGIFGGLVTLVVAFWRRGVSLAGLKNADVADIRKHLASEVKRYADEVDKVTGRQRECEAREEKLRERVRALEFHTDGLYRTIISISAEKVIEMGDQVPPHIRELAVRTLEAQRMGA